jgi:nucleolar complex protein 3
VSAKANGKQRVLQRTTIEVPRGNSDTEDHELDDEDLSIIKQFGVGASFLQTLDEKGISRCAFSLTVTANVHAHS